MKQLLNYNVFIPMLFLFMVGFQNDLTITNKPEGESLQTTTTLENVIPPIVLDETLTECECGTTIDGEPTFVQGTYTYPPIPLTFANCGYPGEVNTGVTITFDAWVCQNRFTIISPTGLVIYNSGWVFGTTVLSFCLPNCTLIVSARSEIPVIDRWKVKFSKCTSCI